LLNGSKKEGKMLFSSLITLGVVLLSIFAWKALNKWIVRRNKAVIFQFRKFTNQREGVQNSAYHADEPPVVDFVDYKYWIRLFPNRGFNLPLIGYYSEFRGRRR
jgi:hypothetical protein